MRIGIDLGGTKIEALALGTEGEELGRIRVPTPRHQYAETLNAIAGLVHTLEADLGQQATVGVGIPGTIMRPSGLVKNANSTWINGQALERDLSAALGREVRCENDPIRRRRCCGLHGPAHRWQARLRTPSRE